MKLRRPLAALGAASVSLGLVVLGFTPASGASPVGASVTSVDVADNGRYIVRLADDASADAVSAAVAALGGRVVAFQNAVHTAVVEVPADARDGIAGIAGVTGVSPDAEMEAQSLGFDASAQAGSMTNVTKITGAQEYWKKGYTGKGVDVAIIDTGVAPVSGLSDSAKVVVGPDLSFESQSDSTRYLDTYGHGTNMAGIIAGREVAQGSGASYASDTTNFYGMAPDSRLVSLKLADHGGAVDVSQMIAAIDWVIANRYLSSNGVQLNIRVLNISYGTISKQDALADPLAWAAEVAWRSGIVVVASAGNDGDSVIGLASPAYNSWLIAVGAADTKGTAAYTDDSVPSFSERGVNGRSPDLVAPGVGVVSLGVPGSYLYDTYSSARLGNGFLRGSGTSQAAAVVSGAAALILSQYTWYQPQDVKVALTATATKLTGVDTTAQGAGELNLTSALARAAISNQTSTATTGNGSGSLEAARGGQNITLDGVPLKGEIDIMGNAWSSGTMSPKAANGTAWNWDGTFNGSYWTGEGMQTDLTTWAGKTWQGKTWQGKTWQGKTWQGKTWQSGTWTGRGWSSASWGTPVPTPSWASKLWASAGWK